MNFNELVAHIFHSDSPDFRLSPQATSHEIDSRNKGIISYLNGLIERNRNADLKFFLLKETPLRLADKQESTLFHTAVLFNNIEVITLLFTLEFDINARNSLGETPLLLAARHKSYQAAELLLTLGADIFVDDSSGENSLTVLLKKENKTPTYLIGSLFQKLINSPLSSNGLVTILVQLGCPIEHVLMFLGAGIMREMLIRLKKIDEDTSFALLHFAMLSRDMRNAKVLLQCGPDMKTRRKKFIEKVTKNIFDPETRPYFEQLVSWDLVNVALLDKTERIFRKANENVIELYLDVGIANYSQHRANRNLMIHLFLNKKIDIEKLLKNRHFDVNSTGAFGATALHLATRCGNEAGVMYLLKNGANPNRRDRNGRTPMFNCYTDEIGKLLLDAGADMFVIDNVGQTIIDADPSELVKAEYCILEAKRSMNEDVPHTMFSQNAVLEPYRKDIQWMKDRKITNSISMLTVLVEKVEKMAQHVKTESTVEALLGASQERMLKPTFACKFSMNLNEAIKMRELQSKAAAFLSEMISAVPPDHLAIEKIMSFMTYQDFMVFDEIDE